MTNSCVICGGEETEGELLLRAPCGNHWVCHDDVGSFFERATENESLYPPKCCDQIFFLADWEGYIPFEVAWAFQLKEQGEYAVLPKFRVYCANTSCVKFLHSSAHITDESTKITYAICEADNCGSITCITCKNLMETGTKDHMCEISENEKKFKDTAKAEGYQECFLCGSTIELTEACNHITCECGNNFCYICGREWNGLHGCPQYGPAEYDEDGYNQEGYHKETGLNRDGLTYRQQLSRDRGEPEDDEEEGDREDEDGDGDDEGNEEAERPDWDVLQHLGEEERAAIDSLPHEFREDALDMVRVQLFEERGITFNQGGDNATQDDDEPERMDVDEDPENGNEDDNGTNEDGELGIEAVQDNAPTDHDRINEVIVQLSQFEVDNNTEDQLEDDAIGSQGFRSNDERASNPPPLGEMQMEEL